MYTPTNELKETKTAMKYVVITGGVVSGLGKGITASSIGLLLKESGLRATAIKIDPYLNIDAGTMSPYEHGEVFVLDDGGEVDLDLGNYERFLDITLTRDHNITTGKVYQKVLATERRGDYLGKTVQMIPHASNCIQEWIEEVASRPVDKSGLPPQVCIIELGGTVGDIESMLFLEAIRQFKFRCGSNLFHVHVSLIPKLGNVGELKSKPTQHSMITLRSTGLIPDCVVLRCPVVVPTKIRNKISIVSMVPLSHIISVHDVANIYQVPQVLLKQGVLNIIFDKLSINKVQSNININKYNIIADKLDDKNDDDDTPTSVTIGIVGKYTGLSDSYLSVTKALLSAALNNDLQLKIVWIESSHLESPKLDHSLASLHNERSPSPEKTPSIEEMKDFVHNISILHDTGDYNDDENRVSVYKNAWNKLKSVDGILIPGGFGDRGVEGKIMAVNYARLNKKPFLGICLGFQMAVIEYCRTVLSLSDANSAEFDKNTKNPAIIFMPEISKKHMGGTMRLGSRKCNLKNNSLAKYLYKNRNEVYERHRHRYEVNPKYVKNIEENGLKFTGKDEKNERMEIIELPLDKHPFFFGVQFHPEFKSGPLRPSPPFMGLIKASSGILYKEKLFIKQFGKIQTSPSKHRIHVRSPQQQKQKKSKTANDGDTGKIIKKLENIINEYEE